MRLLSEDGAASGVDEAETLVAVVVAVGRSHASSLVAGVGVAGGDSAGSAIPRAARIALASLLGGEATAESGEASSERNSGDTSVGVPLALNGGSGTEAKGDGGEWAGGLLGGPCAVGEHHQVASTGGFVGSPASVLIVGVGDGLVTDEEHVVGGEGVPLPERLSTGDGVTSTSEPSVVLSEEETSDGGLNVTGGNSNEGASGRGGSAGSEGFAVRDGDGSGDGDNTVDTREVDCADVGEVDGVGDLTVNVEFAGGGEGDVVDGKVPVIGGGDTEDTVDVVVRGADSRAGEGEDITRLEAGNDHDGKAGDEAAGEVGSREELDGAGSAGVREGSRSDGILLGALSIGGIAGISLNARNVNALVGLGVEVAEVVGQAVDLALVVEALHVGVVVASARLGDALGGPCAARVVVTNVDGGPEFAAVLEDALVTIHAAFSGVVAVSGVERTAGVDDAGSGSGGGAQSAARVHGTRVSSAEGARGAALVDGCSGVDVAFCGRALLSSESLADDFGVGQAASGFNNDGAEASSSGDLARAAELADEAVRSSGASDVEPLSLHGDAHLVLSGRVGGLGDDGVVVPVGEGTSDSVAAGVGSTALPEGSSVGVGFRSIDPLPEASAVLSATEPARGSHLSGDEAVLVGGGDGGEVSGNTGEGLFGAPLASTVEVAGDLVVTVDVAVAGVVVGASAGSPGENALSGFGGGGEVVDGLQDGGVDLRSASTFEAELTEGGEPQLDDAKRSDAVVGSEDVHTARVARADGDGEAVEDALAGEDDGADEGKDGLGTRSVGSVAGGSDVPVAVGVGGAVLLVLFRARRSFRNAETADPGASPGGRVALIFGNTVARVVTSGRALVLVPQAVALLCAVHGSQGSVADADNVGIASLRLQELRWVAAEAARKSLLDDRALAVGASALAVE